MLDKAKKLMMIDDNEVDLKINAKLISLNKIFEDIIICKSGEEASDFLNAHLQTPENLPEFILLDIQMPEMNGYEATQQIRMLETSKRIPIIALTAGTVVGEREKCLGAGMDDYLTKPVVKDTLHDTIRKWLFEKNEVEAY